MRGKLVAGNWKMHGSLAENEALLGDLRAGVSAVAGAECAVCVPFPYLAQVRHLLQGATIAWGAQDASEHGKGAYTGEVSAAMLREFGCRYVIVGHSERRALHAEDNRLVGRKMRAVQAAGITPIVCVGETLAERESGKTESIVAEQLDAVIAETGMSALANAVIAYEPVWAIGSGLTPTVAEIAEVHGHIRRELARIGISRAQEVRILYGGSVKPQNAAELLKAGDVNGALIGGASLKAADFIGIIKVYG
jgi:triosephosphate isomerase